MCDDQATPLEDAPFVASMQKLQVSPGPSFSKSVGGGGGGAALAPIGEATPAVEYVAANLTNGPRMLFVETAAAEAAAAIHHMSGPPLETCQEQQLQFPMRGFPGDQGGAHNSPSLQQQVQMQQQLLQQQQLQRQAAAGAALEQVSRTVATMSPEEQMVWRQRVTAISARYSQSSFDTLDSSGSSFCSNTSSFDSISSSSGHFSMGAGSFGAFNGGGGPSPTGSSGFGGGWNSPPSRGGCSFTFESDQSPHSPPPPPPVLSDLQAVWALTMGSSLSSGSNSSHHGLLRGDGSNAFSMGASAGVLPSSMATIDAAAALVVVGGLGQGGYASVVAAHHRASNVTYALKCVHKVSAQRPKDRLRLTRELQVLTGLSPCPFLLRCHWAFENTRAVFFVLDLVEGGDLFHHLEVLTRSGQAGFGEVAGRFIVAECALGLLHLHSHGIVHRDLKVKDIIQGMHSIDMSGFEGKRNREAFINKCT